MFFISEVWYFLFSLPHLYKLDWFLSYNKTTQQNNLTSINFCSCVLILQECELNELRWVTKTRCHNSQRIDLCITSILRNTIKMFDQIVTCNSCAFLDIVERILKNTLNKHLSLFRKGLCKGLCKEEDRMYAYCYKNNSITFFFPESDQFF